MVVRGRSRPLKHLRVPSPATCCSSLQVIDDTTTRSEALFRSWPDFAFAFVGGGTFEAFLRVVGGGERVKQTS